MEKLTSLAQEFERKLIKTAEPSAFSPFVLSHESMGAALDDMLDGLNQYIEALKKDPGEGDASFPLFLEQKIILETALLAVYPKISELDGKIAELYT